MFVLSPGESKIRYYQKQLVESGETEMKSGEVLKLVGEVEIALMKANRKASGSGSNVRVITTHSKHDEL